MQTRIITELIDHIVNQRIYGEDDISDLTDKIKETGYIKPLQILEDGTVVSGHRRKRACEKLGITVIPVEVVTLVSEEEILERLLLENVNREKTFEQKLAEAEQWKIIHEKRKSKTSEPLTAKQVTQKIAKQVGIGSGATLERALGAKKKAVKLEKQGKKKEASAIKKALKKSPAAAEKEAKKHKIEPRVNPLEEDQIQRAYRRIAAICGNETRKAVESGVLNLTKNDILLWAEQTDGMMLKIQPLIENNRWKTKKSLDFILEDITEDSKVRELVSKAIINNGSFELNLNGYRITVKKE